MFQTPIPVVTTTWNQAATGTAMPGEVTAALDALRERRTERGALVVRGVPVGDLGPTPDSPTGATRKDDVSETTLLDVASRLGEPVGYLPEHGGDIVQNIVPTRAEARRQTSTSSGVTLAFHTETAFHPHRPVFLVLLCLRGDPAAATTLCDVADLVGAVGDDARAVLAEPRFGTRPDESFGGGPDAPLGPPMRVLTAGPAPELLYDEELTRGRDAAAQSALDELASAVARCHTSTVLEAGDVLVVDNRRCVHGRSPFRARFDGTDRWLQRAFVVDDLAASAAERVGRVITTSFAA